MSGFSSFNRVCILAISIASWCIMSCKSQTVITSYLPRSISTAFPQTSESSFDFSGPTAIAVSDFTSPKYYGIFKNTYTRPKIFAVLSQKNAIPTAGYEVPNMKHMQQEYHHISLNIVPFHYEFQYKVHDHYRGSEFGHAESRHGNIAKGQYMVLLPDGRRQIVEYVADSHGYRPTVRYEGHPKIGYGRKPKDSFHKNQNDINIIQKRFNDQRFDFV